MKDNFSILSLQHHNAVKQIEEDYSNLNLFINEMQANINKNDEKSINSYNKAREVAMTILHNIISVKKEFKINSSKDLADFGLIQAHLYFNKDVKKKAEILSDFNNKLEQALSFDPKEVKDEGISKIRLIDFCTWYKTTTFNCEEHSELDCVEEYLKNK